MKQLIQEMNSGQTRVVEVPSPQLSPGRVLVRVEASLVSAGTERTTVQFAQKNIVSKARSRPDLVRMVLDKARRDGLISTLEAARSRLDEPMVLGYSCAGTVIEVAEDIVDIQVGSRVACAGGGHAAHAEIVSVPRNLVAAVPDHVSGDEAAYTTLGSIALHGLRLAQMQLGESVAVIGLGLVGLLAVQLARSAGCCVIGMDPDPDRNLLGRQLGCEATATSNSQMEALARDHTAGSGVDIVIIAAATSSSAPVALAGEISRDRGRVVAVGAVGLDIPRRDYYEKELSFRVSRSYGPGRYDPEYEEEGHDYRIGYVRWTENRNMLAFVDLLAAGRLDVQALTSHRFPIENAPQAYELISGKSQEKSLGVLLQYPADSQPATRVDLPTGSAASTPGETTLTLGLLGAGNFVKAMILPTLKKMTGVSLAGVCTSTGASSLHTADRFGFRYCTSEEEKVLSDPNINVILVGTRHHLHARQVKDSLRAGKHVFCEKPLCLNEAELKEIIRVKNDQSSGHSPQVMVGFNRRFAPLTKHLKEFIGDVNEPLAVHYRVNAGYLERDHWTNDPHQGGGRIIGEACHFVDFLIHLVGALPVRAYARPLPDDGRYSKDNVLITLDFSNGSVGTVSYLACGDKSFPKERVEVFGGGTTSVLDNFRRLELRGQGSRKVQRTRLRQDKGYKGEWEAFRDAVETGGGPPIPFEESVATTLTTFCIMRALSLGEPVSIDTEQFMATAVETESTEGNS